MDELTRQHERRDIDRTPRALSVRRYAAADRIATVELLAHALLRGCSIHFDRGDVCTEPAAIPQAHPRSHVWVADVEGAAVGMIEVVEDHNRTAHVRQLCVSPKWQGIPVAYELVRHAIEHTALAGDLKIVLHAPVNVERAIGLLRHMGLNYAGTKTVGGCCLLEFYLNLYCRVDLDVPLTEGHWHLI